MKTEMIRDDKLSGDTYERWTDGEFSIARYSWWNEPSGQLSRGTFFAVYDLNDRPKRINKKPFASFAEAMAAIVEYRRTMK